MNIGGGGNRSLRAKPNGQNVKPNDAGVSPWTGKSVLVVDDLEPVRDLLCGLYESLGMIVAGTAANGVEVLKHLSTSAVDLVSLDIIMPEMDGIECYRKMRSKGMDCRVVFVSWLAADPRVSETLKSEIPVEIFQGKPVDVESLKARLTQVFNLPIGYVPAPPALTSGEPGVTDQKTPIAV